MKLNVVYSSMTSENKHLPQPLSHAVQTTGSPAGQNHNYPTQTQISVTARYQNHNYPTQTQISVTTRYQNHNYPTQTQITIRGTPAILLIASLTAFGVCVRGSV